MDQTTWACPAYGPEGARIGAVCFFSPTLEKRVCWSEAMCRIALHSERHRVWEEINALADQGEQDFVFLRESIEGPDDLLGGKHGHD